MAENGEQNGAGHSTWIGEKGAGGFDLRSISPQFLMRFHSLTAMTRRYHDHPHRQHAQSHPILHTPR